MIEYNRDLTISWLKSNQSCGFFEGHPENDMNFDTLPDDELRYYFEEWIPEDDKAEWSAS